MIKQKNIITIIVVVFAAAGVSLIASSLVFSTSSSVKVKVENVPPISASFPNSKSTLFAGKNIDPTIIIQIGNNNNNNIFNSNQ